jgi:hypothetical protein
MSTDLSKVFRRTMHPVTCKGSVKAISLNLISDASASAQPRCSSHRSSPRGLCFRWEEEGGREECRHEREREREVELPCSIVVQCVDYTHNSYITIHSYLLN